MIEMVVTGGQTGSDQAGWRAARKAGIKCSGWMPRGYLTEDGPRPEFAEMYGAAEFSSAAYPPRTRANVALADALLWFGNPHSPGGKLTLRLCREEQVPQFVVIRDSVPGDVAGWIADQMIGVEGGGVLLVAGNRESSSPGIGAFVERYLGDVFRLLASQEVETMTRAHREWEEGIL
jgi:hypothetical protein